MFAYDNRSINFPKCLIYPLAIRARNLVSDEGGDAFHGVGVPEDDLPL